MVRQIPNFITCCNLICGCFGIVSVFEGNLVYASYFIWLGGFFDFIDGFAARALKVHSELGKQLDSLADVVTFGVLPGMIVLQLIKQAVFAQFLDWNTPPPEYHLEYLAFIIPALSAVRLAKFNIDTRQTVDFIGLNTPSNAIFFSSFPLILQDDKLGIAFLLQDFRFLIGITILFSILLVSEIRIFSLKFNGLSFKKNSIKYIFLLMSVLLFGIFQFSAIPLIIILYITLSLIQFKLINK